MKDDKLQNKKVMDGLSENPSEEELGEVLSDGQIDEESLYRIASGVDSDGVPKSGIVVSRMFWSDDLNDWDTEDEVYIIKSPVQLNAISGCLVMRIDLDPTEMLHGEHLKRMADNWFAQAGYEPATEESSERFFCVVTPSVIGGKIMIVLTNPVGCWLEMIGDKMRVSVAFDNNATSFATDEETNIMDIDKLVRDELAIEEAALNMEEAELDRLEAERANEYAAAVKDQYIKDDIEVEMKEPEDKKHRSMWIRHSEDDE